MPDAIDDNINMLERCRALVVETIADNEGLAKCIGEPNFKNKLNQALYLQRQLLADIDSTLEKWNAEKSK